MLGSGTRVAKCGQKINIIHNREKYEEFVFPPSRYSSKKQSAFVSIQNSPKREAI